MVSSLLIPSSPDTTGSLNNAGKSSQLGPVTEGTGAMTSTISGVGLMTYITLHAHGQVTG